MFNCRSAIVKTTYLVNLSYVELCVRIQSDFAADKVNKKYVFEQLWNEIKKQYPAKNSQY